MQNLLLAFVLFFGTTQALFAQVIITEIMYDPEGSDSGREWIEIYNTGDIDVDLAGWKFYEQEVNHKLENDNGAVLSAKSYAVIVSDDNVFSSEYSISGLVLDSSFSLKNTGEYIAIRNPELFDTDSIFYDTTIGAKGDGNSLQKIDGVWVYAIPTPGVANVKATTNTQEATSENDDEANQSSTQQSVSFGSSFAYVDMVKVYADAGEDRNMIVGAGGVFSGRAYGADGELLENPRFVWNFGDGSRAEGESVLHNYRFPGEYLVVLNISSGKYTASDRIKIKANPAELAISEVSVGMNGFIQLKNSSKQELELSGWHLRADDLHFTFPKDTFILPNTTLFFPASVTKLFVKNKKSVSILYPNGEIASTFTSNKHLVPEVPSARASSVNNYSAKKPTVQTQIKSKKPNQPHLDLQGPSGVEENVTTTTNTASVIYSVDENDFNKSAIWFAIFFWLVVISIVGYLLVRKKESGQVQAEWRKVDDVKQIADKVNIIED